MSRQTLRTEVCDMLEIEYPIFSAGMGPSLIGEKVGAPVELVVAVSEAGAIGVLGGPGDRRTRRLPKLGRPKPCG